MTAIGQVMIEDHARLDATLDRALLAAARAAWTDAKGAFAHYEARLRRHIGIEEKILFPAFDRAVGTDRGYTGGLREEHEQILGLMDEIRTALASSQPIDAAARKLRALIEVHETGEEQVLAPACEKSLAEDERARIAAALQAAPEGAAP